MIRGADQENTTSLSPGSAESNSGAPDGAEMERKCFSAHSIVIILATIIHTHKREEELYYVTVRVG